jgi:hypothetical protein
MDVLPPEIWVEILKKVKSPERKIDISSIARFARVCKYAYQITCCDYLWRHVCGDFCDFKKLQKQTGTWYQKCKNRVCNTFDHQNVKNGFIEITGRGRLIFGSFKGPIDGTIETLLCGQKLYIKKYDLVDVTSIAIFNDKLDSVYFCISAGSLYRIPDITKAIDATGITPLKILDNVDKIYAGLPSVALAKGKPYVIYNKVQPITPLLTYDFVKVELPVILTSPGHCVVKFYTKEWKAKKKDNEKNKDITNNKDTTKNKDKTKKDKAKKDKAKKDKAKKDEEDKYIIRVNNTELLAFSF